MEKQLVSVDLRSDFGFFKKPEINAGVSFTYNFVHKPALLGVFGAIAGLGGFYDHYIFKKTKRPQYYEEFKKLKISIAPLGVNEVNRKHFITYTNTVGYANDDGNLILKEQTLVKPNFRIYIMSDKASESERILLNNLKNVEAVYIPYMGKNEYPAYWTNYTEYDIANHIEPPKDNYRIVSLFIKPPESTIKEAVKKQSFSFLNLKAAQNSETRVYFERLPLEYNEQSNNYVLREFVYSTMMFSDKFDPGGLIRVSAIGEEYIQLF